MVISIDTQDSCVQRKRKVHLSKPCLILNLPLCTDNCSLVAGVRCWPLRIALPFSLVPAPVHLYRQPAHSTLLFKSRYPLFPCLYKRRVPLPYLGCHKFSSALVIANVVSFLEFLLTPRSAEVRMEEREGRAEIVWWRQQVEGQRYSNFLNEMRSSLHWLQLVELSTWSRGS